MPIQVKNTQVIGTELVAHQRHYRFGLEGRCKAVSQVTGHRQRVLGSERTLGDSQNIKLHRRFVASLVLVDAVQIGHQRLVGRVGHVHALGYTRSMLADAERAKQAVGIKQFGTQNFCQFTLCQSAHHLHLEQPVLGVHVAQRPVHVGLVLRVDVGHAAFVVADAHLLLQATQIDGALAHHLFALQIPNASAKHQERRHKDQFECCFHGARA